MPALHGTGIAVLPTTAPRCGFADADEALSSAQPYRHGDMANIRPKAKLTGPTLCFRVPFASK